MRLSEVSNPFTEWLTGFPVIAEGAEPGSVVGRILDEPGPRVADADLPVGAEGERRSDDTCAGRVDAPDEEAGRAWRVRLAKAYPGGLHRWCELSRVAVDGDERQEDVA